jgi:hypothetical protein
MPPYSQMFNVGLPCSSNRNCPATSDSVAIAATLISFAQQCASRATATGDSPTQAGMSITSASNIFFRASVWLPMATLTVWMKCQSDGSFGSSTTAHLYACRMAHRRKALEFFAPHHQLCFGFHLVAVKALKAANKLADDHVEFVAAFVRWPQQLSKRRQSCRETWARSPSVSVGAFTSFGPTDGASNSAFRAQMCLAVRCRGGNLDWRCPAPMARVHALNLCEPRR